MVSFSNINTPEAFKAFLQNYHQTLVGDKSFPPLSVNKALHLAATVFGEKNWHTLLAHLDDNVSEQPPLRDVAALTIMEFDSHSSLKLTNCNTYILDKMDKLTDTLRDLCKDKITDNDRPYSEVIECMSIETPEAGKYDDDEEAGIEWVLQNNSYHELAQLLEFLDYGLTKVNYKVDWHR